VDTVQLSELTAQVQVHCISRPPGSRNPYHFAKSLKAFRAFRPSVVHIHQNSLIHLTRWLSAPTVLTVHDTVFGNPKCFSLCKKVIAISGSVRNAISASNTKADAEVIFNGIRCRDIQVRAPGASSEFRIVQVGRLELPKKGQDIAVQAISELTNAKKANGIFLDFIGEGPAFAELEKMIAAYGLRDRIRFRGLLSRQEIYSCLSQYDLLIQPSRFEGFGLTVAEAMVAKLPVLVADIEGPKELVQNGQYGAMFRAGDASDLANKILEQRIWAETASTTSRIEEARQIAMARFDVAGTARAYEDIYLKIAH